MHHDQKYKKKKKKKKKEEMTNIPISYPAIKKNPSRQTPFKIKANERSLRQAQPAQL